MSNPRAFYIPANKNFLEELALGILSRFDKISDITILLPSNRSCIELEKIIIKHIKEPILLPQIIPIRELGKERQLAEYINLDNTKKHLSEFEHILHLTNIIRKKTQEKISYNKALNIASSLSDIIIRFTKNHIPLSRIKDLYFPDAAEHIENLIEYLHIAAEEWPKFLLEHNSIDFLNDNNIYVEYLINQWNLTPPTQPIIAAGSTGSVISTSKLLQALSSLNNGFLILKSVDFDIPDYQWNKVEEHHHSFLTKQLLEKIGINKNSLTAWHSHDSQKTSTQEFISSFMAPTSIIEDWHNLTINIDSNHIFQIIECDNIQEEACLINIKIRQILENNPDENIAIITNNTDLINRILILSKKWGINIYSFRGQPLYTTKPYSFISHILNAISENFSPVYLLALLKHPLFKVPIDNLKESIAELEMLYLRGIARYDNLEQLINITKNKHFNITTLLKHIENTCNNLIQYSKTETVNFRQIIKDIITTAEKLSSEEKTTLWSNPEGITLYKYLADILEASYIIQHVEFSNIQNILRTLIQNKTSNNNTKSNIKILSNIESRLLSFDHIIIAGLNENDWPPQIPFDPWLTNNMYKQLHLTSPEQTIGQAAYDFFSLLQHPNILLTRSLNHNSSITVPTRWLVRMEILGKKLNILEKIKPQNHYLKTWTQHILYKQNIEENFIPPQPRPSRKNSLKKLSVTKIEKLIRDPYSIYISEILKLKKLEEIDAQPEQKEFGIFIHSVMDQFNKEFDTTNNHKELLIKISERTLKSITTNQTIQHLWTLKLDQMIDWIIHFEISKRQHTNINIYTELTGHLNFGNDFILTMKADRIEVEQNLITIIDFKTGTLPTQKDIQQSFSPQLLLEALITLKGNLKDISFADTSNKKIQLLYIQLSSGKNLGKITVVNLTPETSIEYIEDNLEKFIQQFNQGAPFLISPRAHKAPKYNEISHLEREE